MFYYLNLPIGGDIEPLQLAKVRDQSVNVVHQVIIQAEDAQLGQAGEGADFGVGNLEVVVMLFGLVELGNVNFSKTV